MSLSKKERDDFKEVHTTFQYNRLHELSHVLANQNAETTERSDLPNLKLSSVLGPLYLKKFFNSCKKNSVILPEDIRGTLPLKPRLKKWEKFENDVKNGSLVHSKSSQTEGVRFCSNCGNLRLPGVNTVQRLVTKDGKQCVQLNCLLCDEVTELGEIEIPSASATRSNSHSRTTTPSLEQQQQQSTAKNVLNKPYSGIPSKGPLSVSNPTNSSSNAKNKVAKPEGKNAVSKQRAKMRKSSTLSNMLKQKKLKEDNKSKSSLNLADFLKK